jgi:hypothetical protein
LSAGVISLETSTTKQRASAGDSRLRWRRWLLLQRKTRVDKDVRRTDRTQPFFTGPKNPNVKALRCICLSYTMYNFDLSYCQARA